jgi:hypothetical protein
MDATVLATRMAAGLGAAIFAVLAAIHMYWALGGRWGADAAFPPAWRGAAPTAPVSPNPSARRHMHPTPLATLAVALALLAAGAVLLGRAGWLPLGPSWLLRAGAWVLCVLFLARASGDFRTFGFFKSRRGTLFANWDTRLFSPLCLVISALSGVVAWWSA